MGHKKETRRRLPYFVWNEDGYLLVNPELPEEHHERATSMWLSGLDVGGEESEIPATENPLCVRLAVSATDGKTYLMETIGQPMEEIAKEAPARFQEYFGQYQQDAWQAEANHCAGVDFYDWASGELVGNIVLCAPARLPQGV